MWGSVDDWAKRHGISRQAAYKRIREHSIPMKGSRLDMDLADKIWAESHNPAKQRGGVAGGEAAKSQHAGQGALFEAEPDDTGQPPVFGAPSAAGAPRFDQSLLGRAQLQHTLLRARREQLTIDQLEKKVVPLADARQFYAALLANMKSELLTIPGELADELAAESDAIQIKAKLERRILRVLSTLAEFQAETE